MALASEPSISQKSQLLMELLLISLASPQMLTDSSFGGFCYCNAIIDGVVSLFTGMHTFSRGSKQCVSYSRMQDY